MISNDQTVRKMHSFIFGSINNLLYLYGLFVTIKNPKQCDWEKK
jgi:hypothetical protein